MVREGQKSDIFFQNENKSSFFILLVQRLSLSHYEVNFLVFFVDFKRRTLCH
jgi:hypothetical protein